MILPEDRGRVVLIFGMHKSGLSIAAKMIEAFDFQVESEKISAVNASILKYFNLAWPSVESISPQNLLTMPAEFYERASDIVSEALSTSSKVAFKDAQFCRLMPFWQNLLGNRNIPVQCVIMNRHPYSVARSLSMVHNLQLDHSLDLWRAHMLEASSFMHPAWRRLVVDYDLVLDDPLGQLTRVSEFLDLSSDFAKVAAFKEFVHKGSRHAFANPRVVIDRHPNHQVLWENLYRLSKGERVPTQA